MFTDLNSVQEIIYILLKWLFDHYIELFATISGLLYLVYSVKGNILLWFFGLITSLLYVYVFFISKIYADMGINIYYVIISIYGWIHWSRLDENIDKRTLPYSTLLIRTGIILFFITLLLFILIAFILNKYTDSDIALWDSFTTSASITATWMLARKIIEHWLVWIVIDSVSAGLYIYKGLYPTVLLFVVYATLAVIGYIEWKKQFRLQNSV
ncbi:MAG: nicotinamide mononucleotide transporter [Bacteroidales bacterium]|nr:nicotinamide mononucleotide transporter [Bacteroidales bacterium]